MKKKKDELTFKKINVRLDAKTIVVLRDISFFDKWKRIYPEAKIID